VAKFTVPLQNNTLERMKGKGQQKIIVEKVNIEAGG
jgi:hypothetical protein